MIRRRRTTMAAVLVLGTLLTGCGGTGSTGGAPGVDPTLRIATRDIDDLDEYGGEATIMGTQVEETLTQFDDASGQVVPWLAKEVPTTSDNGVNWDITVRDGVTWHDGTPLDAASVVAAFERAIPNNGAELAGFVGAARIAGVTATGPMTLRLTYKSSEPLVPRMLAIFKLQKATGQADHPIGTGPYKLDRWQRGQSVKLTRNDAYWGPKPQVKDIDFRIVPDAGARLSALLAKEVDLITNLQPEDAKRVPHLIDGESIKFPLFVLNTESGPTADVRVRQAMNHAIDQQAILEQIYGGYGDVENCQANGPGNVGYNASLKPYAFDVEKAKQLIREAGAEGASIKVLGVQGRWLKDREITDAVAQMWRDIGLNATVTIAPTFDQWSQGARDKTDARPSAYFVTRNLFERDLSGLRYYLLPREMGFSYSNYANKAVSDPFLTANASVDVPTRDAAFQKIAATVCDDAPFAFGVRPRDLYGVADGVTVKPQRNGETYLKAQDVTMTSSS